MRRLRRTVFRLTSTLLLAHALFGSSIARAGAEDPGGASTDPDFFAQSDKRMHMGASVALVTGTYSYLRGVQHMSRWNSLMGSMAVSLMCGFAKEMIDPYVDTADMRADAIGTLGGGTIMLSIDILAF